jgi:iron complex outermembrane receptor protein
MPEVACPKTSGWRFCGLPGFALWLLLFAASPQVWSQQTILYGTVTDRETGETLLGVNFLLEDSTGTTSDLEGNYRLILNPDRQRFTISYLGYEPQNRVVSLMPGEERRLDVQLIPKSQELAVMVVSTSQYEKSLEETSISIDVLPSRLIANTNSVTLNDALQRAPGVYLLDGQANIRGGTGFTYGAGSRVLLVLDDQPLLTADRSDAKWAFIPIENVEQIEVI